MVHAFPKDINMKCASLHLNVHGKSIGLSLLPQPIGKFWFGLVSLFNGISNFMVYFVTKSI